MTKFKLEIEGMDMSDVLKYREIFAALLSSGGLSGVKGGKTIIHFDGEGNFMGITLDYWVWKRRKT